MAFNIVLLEPEIAGNTGNIARTCAATGTRLHLIRPLGFEVTDRNLKRAGMDYWYDVEVFYYDNLDDFWTQRPEARSRLALATTKAFRTYTDFAWQDEAWIMFGKESAGLPESLLVQHPEAVIRIPMKSSLRSLNLSNAAAIILYEALRQTGFPGLEEQGQLHRERWPGE